MHLFYALIDWVLDPASTQDRDQRYLAQSVDLHDLERRLRQVETRQVIGPFGQNV